MFRSLVILNGLCLSLKGWMLIVEKTLMYMRKGGIVAYTWDDVCYLVDSGKAILEDFVLIFEE